MVEGRGTHGGGGGVVDVDVAEEDVFGGYDCHCPCMSFSVAVSGPFPSGGTITGREL